ncbi:MAG: hypothetical protein A4E45_01256 [Methanosaeta sp. PtaB.Bin039]|nr:MAG: hypothetical protein A4E45_01256 [Methanosaeta sp. PtaB.Bin039]OPY46226.1 MAG: hypothetical protein A4E47_00660 [Methanosaeta sp. PtaU1.Bin028]HOT06465.1 hypothetical protein [Methanotrichaceae archaeon]HQF16236.1 hypothetical protein [Methanotrichaceae archaeon]HQI90972.1 hypothetical protein [Methanotrichaceae archaeon]
MEIWQVVVVCIMALPVFYALNYLVVVRAARDRRSRDLRIEKTVAARVSRDYGGGRTRFVTRKYRPRKPGGSS